MKSLTSDAHVRQVCVSHRKLINDQISSPSKFWFHSSSRNFLNPSGMISFGTCTSVLTVVSNGLMGDITTFQVPDKRSKCVLSLVWTKTFPCIMGITHSNFSLFDILAARGKVIFSPEFFLGICDQYRQNIDDYYTNTSELMFELNVCSLGWVIESNTVRSVTVGFLFYCYFHRYGPRLSNSPPENKS